MQEMEVKRGSAQMNMRLQRQQRSKPVKQDSFAMFAEMNGEELDRQIEHSIKVSFLLLQFQNFNFFIKNLNVFSFC